MRAFRGTGSCRRLGRKCAPPLRKCFLCRSANSLLFCNLPPHWEGRFLLRSGRCEVVASRVADQMSSYSAGAEADMKQRWGVIGLVAVISFLSGGWLLQRGVASDGNVYQQARLFDDVLGHVSTYYVDSIGETDLYQKATRGMLEQLKDPYSVLLTGDDYKALTEQTSGNYAGLGIQIDVRDGWITVVAPDRKSHV